MWPLFCYFLFHFPSLSNAQISLLHSSSPCHSSNGPTNLAPESDDQKNVSVNRERERERERERGEKWKFLSLSLCFLLTQSQWHMNDWQIDSWIWIKRKDEEKDAEESARDASIEQMAVWFVLIFKLTANITHLDEKWLFLSILVLCHLTQIKCVMQGLSSKGKSYFGDRVDIEYGWERERKRGEVKYIGHNVCKCK